MGLIPSLDQLMWFFVGVLAALPVPYWYANERIQGFARWLLAKLPYEPPPGKTEEEALEEAQESEE